MTLAPEQECLLVVDDSTATLEILERNLIGAGYQVFTACDVATALRTLEQTRIDLVVTDLKMPRVSGLDLVRHVRENLIDTEVIMITGYPSVEGAVEAVKTGAEEYLSKPFTDEELIAAVRRALDKLRMRRRGWGADRQTSGQHGPAGCHKYRTAELRRWRSSCSLG